LKAVLSAGGWGSRFFPVAKAVSKCLLPVLDKPVIHYIVEECVRAGVRDIAIITPPGALGEQVKYYFSRDLATERHFRNHGWNARYKTAARLPELAEFTFLAQPMDGRYGTAVPPLIARRFIGDDDFFSINCDDLLVRFDGGCDLSDLLTARNSAGAAAALGAMTMAADQAANYGVLLTTTSAPRVLTQVRDKPGILPPGQYLVAIGRALLPAEFLTYLDRIECSPVTGEFQVTDAYAAFARDADVLVHPVDGTYFDCGGVPGWLAANAALAEHHGIPIGRGIPIGATGTPETAGSSVR
jgi:UTP--glucose-1-phosphate uridylyltransferase